MAIYRVKGPDGSIYKLQGPDNATQEQILSAAQQQFAAQPAPSPTPQEARPNIAGQIGQEIAAPFKQLYNVQKNASISDRGRGLLFSLLLGPAAGQIATAKKGERLKTAGALGEAATYAIPGAGELKGLATAAKLGKLAKSGAVAGTLYGAGSALRSGETDPTKIGQEAVTGGVVGAATNPVLEPVGNAVANSILGKAAKLYDSVILGSAKEAREATRAAIKSGGKIRTTGQQVADRGGLRGVDLTLDKVRSTADSQVDVLEQRIQPVIESLKNNGVTVSADEATSPIVSAIRELNDKGLSVPQALKGTLAAMLKKADKNGQIPIDVANTMKREYYAMLRSKKASMYVPAAELPQLKQVLREAASGLHKAIEGAAKGTKLESLNAEQGLHMQVRNTIEDAMVKADEQAKQQLARSILSRVGLSELFTGTLALGAVGLNTGSITQGALAGGALYGLTRSASSVPGRLIRAKAGIAATKAGIPQATMKVLRNLGIQATTQRKK